jgi:hypothetical protein
MKFLFAREILDANFDETTSDVFSLFKTFGMIDVMMQVFMGNSEQWDMLFEMEQNMTLNATEGIDGLG